MSRWKVFIAVLVVVGMLAGVTSLSSQAMPSRQTDAYVISSPSDGATVSGAVEIIGTVTHPNFASYGVFYAPGERPTGDSRWVRIAFESQPVVNGVLATWDTLARGADGQPVVSDGVYTLALARYQQGSGGPDEPLYFVSNVTVSNQGVEPTPTATPTVPPIPTTDSGAGGAMPTPVTIEQPPTATPGSTSEPQPDETPVTSTEETDEGGFTLDTARLRGAFVDGVKLTLLFFALWGVYVLCKAVVRYLLRHRGLSLPWRSK